VKKLKKHIEIVSSSKTYLSSMSYPSRQAIAGVLRERYENVSIALVDTKYDLDELVARGPDIVFLGLKYVPHDLSQDLQNPNKIWVSHYLTQNSLNHTGSSHDAHKLDIDKSLAKAKLRQADLKTADYMLLRQGQELKSKDVTLEYPLFVKPTNRGGGLGIDEDSIVYSFTELARKVNIISEELRSDVLVEQYLSGREFSVAILRSSGAQSYQVVPVELIAEANEKGQRVLGEEAKAANREQAIELPPGQMRRSISELALRSFKELGGRDYGRIDIRLNEHGEPHFLEANLLPSLICDYGTFPKACKLGLGMEYPEVIYRIVQLAAERSSQANTAQVQHKNLIIPSFLHS